MSIDAQVADAAVWLAIAAAAVIATAILYGVARALSPLVVGVLIRLGVIE